MNNIRSRVEPFFEEMGNVTLFINNIFSQFFRKPFENKELIRQAYYIGYKTVPLISITGFIMGLVLTIQSRPILVDFGAQDLLPGMISVSIVREIGPVITALLCAGKISSGIGAELGSMRVTEQIDAMEVSGTNPMKYVVTTRVLASTIMIPLLVFVTDAVGLFGSFVAINMRAKIEWALYISQAFDALDFSDIIPATIKTFFFGFFIGVIGCYKGYYAERGTESVGVAANTAVVTSSMSIFVIDLIAVQITQLVYG